MFTHTHDQKLIIHDFKISENKEKLVLQRNLRNQKLQSKVNNNLFIYYACYNFFWKYLMMMMMMITGALKKKGKESPTGQKGSVGFSKMTPLDEEAEEETSKSVAKKVKVKTGTVSVKQ